MEGAGQKTETKLGLGQVQEGALYLALAWASALSSPSGTCQTVNAQKQVPGVPKLRAVNLRILQCLI